MVPVQDEAFVFLRPFITLFPQCWNSGQSLVHFEASSNHWASFPVPITLRECKLSDSVYSSFRRRKVPHEHVLLEMKSEAYFAVQKFLSIVSSRESGPKLQVPFR